MWGHSHLWIALFKGHVKLSERQLDHKVAICFFYLELSLEPLKGTGMSMVLSKWNIPPL